MMKILKIYFTLFLGFLLYQAKAQETVSIPNPEAAALGTYGQFPVELSSGIPQIGIPIYQVSAGQLGVGISLSYHASGIKVEEKATSVGLGWALNAGGIITRMTRGLPDESDSNGYLAGYYGTDFPRPSEFGNGSTRDFALVEGVVQGYQDTQPDLFFYNFNGRSGKFFIGQNQQPVTIPLEDIHIEFTSNLSEFKIIDEGGTIYRFADKANVYSGERPMSWYLSEIISSDGKDKITFEYSESISLNSRYYRDSETIGQQPIDNGPGSSITYTTLSGANTVNGAEYSEVIYIETIKFDQGKVTFQYTDDRLDAGDSGKRLDQIVIHRLTPADGSYQTVKSFHFDNTSYFPVTVIGNNRTPTYAGADKRLKLDKLEELDNQGNVIKTHSFEYNNEPLPHKNSTAQDHWGYYNGVDSNTNLIAAGGTTTFGFLNYTVSNANRETNPAKIQAGMLTQINFPTGGYTNFTYDNPQLVKQEVVNVQQGPYGNTIPNFQTVVFTPTNMYNSNATVEVKFDLNEYAPGYGPASNCSSSDQGQAKIILREKVSLTEVNNWQATTNSDGSASDHYSTTQVYLDQGKEYEFILEYSGTFCAYISFVSVKISWDVLQNVNIPVGAVRIKKIESYTSPGVLANTQTFEYSDPVLLTSLYPVTYSRLQNYKLFYICGGIVVCDTPYELKHYSAQSIKPLSSQRGSIVGYEQVTSYNGTSTDNIGKTVQRFDIAPDPGSEAAEDFSWQSGQLKWVKNYKRVESQGVVSYIKVSETVNDYQLFEQKFNYYPLIRQHVIYTGTTDFPTTLALTEFTIFENTGQTGVKKLTQTTSYTYSPNDTTVFQTQTADYVYNSKNLQLASQSTTDSKGDKHSANNLYPEDYSITCDTEEEIFEHLETAKASCRQTYPCAPGDDNCDTQLRNCYNSAESTALAALATMQTCIENRINNTSLSQAERSLYLMRQKHITAPAIEQRSFQEKSGSAKELLGASKTDFRIINRNTSQSLAGIPVPDTVYTTELDKPLAASSISDWDALYEPQMAFLEYDQDNNLLSQAEIDDVPLAYIWGYKKDYPIAQVANATDSSVNGTPYNLPTLIASRTGVKKMNVPEKLYDFHISFQQQVTITFSNVNMGNTGLSASDLHMRLILKHENGTVYLNNSYPTNASGSPIQISVSLPIVGNYSLSYIQEFIPTDNSNYNGLRLEADLNYQGYRIHSKIYHTSFEEDATLVNTTEHHTGRQSHTGTYIIPLPAQVGTYILSYWTKSGTNPWQYQEQEINITTPGTTTATIGSSGILLDEVRLHPKEALMTTYTYDPLIGMTTSTDAQNRTTYYEYDDFNRLKLVRDFEGNIVQQYEYHYQGQN